MADRYDIRPIVERLSQRKTVIVQPRVSEDTSLGPAVIAPGTVTPEQGFVHVSSVCFACFVKFLSDHLWILKTGQTDPEMDAVYQKFCRF